MLGETQVFVLRIEQGVFPQSTTATLIEVSEKFFCLQNTDSNLLKCSKRSKATWRQATMSMLNKRSNSMVTHQHLVSQFQSEDHNQRDRAVAHKGKSGCLLGILQAHTKRLVDTI